MAKKETEVVTSDQRSGKSAEGNRTDMPVSAVARLLGVATQTDLTLVEGKVDLLINKLNLMQVRVEKTLTAVGSLASGADLERIDVQIGALRTSIREALSGVPSKAPAPAKEAAPKAAPEPAPAPTPEPAAHPEPPAAE